MLTVTDRPPTPTRSNIYKHKTSINAALLTHTLVDKEGYFSSISNAYSLQVRWKDELGIDIIERIMQTLREASGMKVRLAREGEGDYFAGVVRAIDTGIQIHADYAPFVSPFLVGTLHIYCAGGHLLHLLIRQKEGNGWEIGRIVAQMSWNILLNPVPGGDTVIFDRQWQAPQDDLSWRKDFPKYAYDPRMVDGHCIKVVKPTPGDLYWFNPR